MNRIAVAALTGLTTALSMVLAAPTADAAVRAGFESSTFGANDDGSTSAQNLGFQIDFFGVVSSTVYVNNNGNITIDTPLSTYTPFDLTSTGRQIIAPYFADVDTRTNSTPVRYGQGTVNGRPAFGVTWNTVNCYSAYTSRSQRNTFQVILIERSDTGTDNFDIEFNFDQVQWEAGQASGGNSQCLGGGSAARVGYSNGTGDPGTFFELPGSNTNGAFLDGGPTALVNSSLNSQTLGRYVFQARAGGIVQPGDIPIGVTGGPYVGDEGVPVPLDGSASLDPDGTVQTWSWDCDSDGTYEVASSSSPFATCTYPDNGVYPLSMLVGDDEGNLNLVATNVVVNNVDPAGLAITGPSTGSEGGTLSFSAFATDVAADPLTYTWDFGDGNTATGSSVSNLFADDGTYLVRVDATDTEGGDVFATATVTISNVAPTITSMITPASGVEGGALTMSATGTDPGADTPIFRWDFGDGTQLATGASVGHVYADEGTYTITLTLTDDNGAVDTQTSTITISNVNPSIVFTNFPAGGDEGATLLFEAAATDVLADTLTYTWDFNDGTIAVGASVTHVYADEGNPNVVLTVTDGDGGSVSASQVVPIQNVDPQIANVAVPATGGEGQAIAMSADAVDAAGDAMTFVWDYGDGTSDTYALPLGNNSSSTTHAYADEGTYQITITVTDGDGGQDIFNQSVITIDNLDPVVSSLTVPDGNEGDALSFAVVATDAPGDPLTYQWDFGDGTTAAGPTATKTYTDDGNYTVTMTIQDDGEGGETIVTDVANITNVAPTITSFTAPGTGGEGEVLTFEVVSDDAGVADLPDHVATWDWGDGSSDTGASVTHAWIDQGTWTVTLTVDDQDGGTVTQQMTVVTDNVAPTITSTPPTNAVQGTLYTYQVVVDEPGDDVLTFSLAPSAPAGMTMDTATGLIEFTATYAQSLAGPYTIVIGVDDNEGGVDGQVYTLNVLSADTDGDGIADDWETANGLDPNDSGDGNLDYDLDGLTNVEEFGLDQDPFGYDGPSAPVATFPVGGEETDTDRPDLTVDNAIDPNGDPLTYEFEVYSDVSLSTLVTSMVGVAEDASGSTFWKVDVPLNENTDYWWRARANDGNVAGGWTATEGFFVNTENEEPDAVTLVWPIGGESTGTLTPDLEWVNSEDPDRDVVTYDVEVWDEAGEVLITSATGVPAGSDVNATWTVDLTLDEDTIYTWMVQPVDEHGLGGEWTEPESFFSDGTDEAPQGVAFIDPTDGDTLVDQTPDLVASAGWDPEGTALTWRFEVDTVDTFDSPDFEAADITESSDDEVVWSLSETGVTLPQNTTIYARVSAMDEGGVASAPDTISFFVRGENDPPNVPVLVSPEDGTDAADTTPELVVETPIDPEGDVAYVEFALALDIDMADVIVTNEVLATGDTTSWVVDPPQNGTFYWSARARDEDGAWSDWADPWLYTAPDPVEPPGDDDDDDGGLACDCNSSMVGPSAAPGWLLVLLAVPALAVRRRR